MFWSIFHFFLHLTKQQYVLLKSYKNNLIGTHLSLAREFTWDYYRTTLPIKKYFLHNKSKEIHESAWLLLEIFLKPYQFIS